MQENAREDIHNTLRKANAKDLTDYLFLPNSFVSMLTLLSISITDGNCILLFSKTKLFFVDLRLNNKVVFRPTALET